MIYCGGKTLDIKKISIFHKNIDSYHIPLYTSTYIISNFSVLILGKFGLTLFLETNPMIYYVNHELLSVWPLSTKVIPHLQYEVWYPQKIITYLTGAFHILISYRSRVTDIADSGHHCCHPTRSVYMTFSCMKWIQHDIVITHW